MLYVDQINRFVKFAWSSALKFLSRNELAIALLVTAALIVSGLFLGWENNKIVPVSANPFARYTQEPSNPLKFMADWDGPDYLEIATKGYTSVAQANFFPLYPRLVYIVNKVVDSPLDSALLVSWVSTVGAVYFYFKIIKTIFKVRSNLDALRGVLLFVLFPTGVFLIATYTEALFAFLALGAIYYALQKRYLPSVLFTAFSTATHITGLFIVVLIALIMAEHKEKVIKILGAAIAGGLGLVAYAVFLSRQFHKPFAFISAQKSHGWVDNGYSHLLSSIDFMNVIIIVLLIVAIIYWWKRRKSFAVYSFLFLCIPVLGGQFGGFNRYALMAFPVQFMLYEHFRNSKLAYPMAIAIFSVFWAYFVFQYAGGYVGG